MENVSVEQMAKDLNDAVVLLKQMSEKKPPVVSTCKFDEVKAELVKKLNLNFPDPDEAVSYFAYAGGEVKTFATEQEAKAFSDMVEKNDPYQDVRELYKEFEIWLESLVSEAAYQHYLRELAELNACSLKEAKQLSQKLFEHHEAWFSWVDLAHMPWKSNRYTNALDYLCEQPHETGVGLLLESYKAHEKKADPFSGWRNLPKRLEFARACKELAGLFNRPAAE